MKEKEFEKKEILITSEEQKVKIQKQLEDIKKEIIELVQRIEAITAERKQAESRINYLVGSYDSLSKLIGVPNLFEDGTIKLISR